MLHCGRNATCNRLPARSNQSKGWRSPGRSSRARHANRPVIGAPERLSRLAVATGPHSKARPCWWRMRHERVLRTRCRMVSVSFSVRWGARPRAFYSPPQHFLNLAPLPHGHGAFRPVWCRARLSWRSLIRTRIGAISSFGTETRPN